MTTTFAKPSLTTRIGIGKLVGFLIGLMGFILIPYILPEASLHFRIGILLWYGTMGAVIGVYGIYTRHPVLKLPMPWWYRAPVIGAWMNFVISLFAYDPLKSMMEALAPVTGGTALSPFWFVAEGALVGFLIGAIATKLGGQGPETLEADL